MIYGYLRENEKQVSKEPIDLITGLPRTTLKEYLNIIRDDTSTKFYEDYGYKVVRIPYFIQLSNDTVEQLFDVKVNTKLFDYNFTSLHPDLRNTPAYLCPLGIERMKAIFNQFPKQYRVNKLFLEQLNQPLLTGINYL